MQNKQEQIITLVYQVFENLVDKKNSIKLKKKKKNG